MGPCKGGSRSIRVLTLPNSAATFHMLILAPKGQPIEPDFKRMTQSLLISERR